MKFGKEIASMLPNPQKISVNSVRSVAKCPFFSRLFGDLTKVFMPSHSWRSARNYRNHLHRQTGYHIHVNNNGEFRNIHCQSPSFGHIGRLKTRVYNKIK
jgi:hypothetical protein